ncbi:hypothetical protein LTR17_011953 [Elasticomyces elasticus]|nr:hypothetical protein LTR17_011953 [Elasticomyces elasticus]
MPHDALVVVLLRIQAYGFIPTLQAVLLVYPGFFFMRWVISITILSPELRARIRAQNEALAGAVGVEGVGVAVPPWQGQELATRLVAGLWRVPEDFWLAVSFASTPIVGVVVIVGLQIVVMGLCAGVIYMICKRGGMR